MAAAGRIGVGKLVDEDDARMAGDDGIEVHFLDRLAVVDNGFAGNDFEALEQGFGLLASMGLDYADDHIDALLALCLGVLEHFVGLADAGRGADENPQLAGTACLLPGRFQQGFRRWTLFEIATLFCHWLGRLAHVPTEWKQLRRFYGAAAARVWHHRCCV